MWPVLIAAGALRFADIILLESSLSFLGLGMQPLMLSWGRLIRDGRDVMADAWLLATFPGMAITITVLSLHWLADGVRQAFI